MKRFFAVLNLLLCLELVVRPFAPQISLMIPLSAKAQETSCPAGTQFDTTLNRCITSAQTATIMNAVASCAAGDKACYKANAESALKKGEQEDKVAESIKNKSGMFNKSMTAAATAVPMALAAYILLGVKKKGVKCGSMSLYMMAGAGAALFIGNTWANHQHKGRLKKIRKEWEGIVKPNDKDDDKSTNVSVTNTNPDDQKVQATEAQSEAFEMLAKSEDSLASAAKMKTGFFGVATAAFAASAVMATLEHFKVTSLKAAYAKTLKNNAPLPAQQQAWALYQKEHIRVTCTKDGVTAEPTAPSETPTVPAQPVTPSGPTQKESFIEIPFNKNLEEVTAYNMRSAPNLASYMVLNDELYSISERNSSPTLDEYEQYNELIKDSGLENDSSLLKLVKKVAFEVINGISPISIAHAQVLIERTIVTEKYAQPANPPPKSDAAGTNSAAPVDAAVGTKPAAPVDAAVGTKPAAPVDAAAAAQALQTEAGTKAITEVNSQNAAKAKGLDKFLTKPLTRAVISGVFAGWSGVMTMHAMKQAKASKARAKYLRGIKDTFNNATGAISCSSQERTNSNNPNCYCYTSAGGRNPQRANSDVCTKLFTGKSINGPVNYLSGAGSVNQKVCMTTSGVDELCKCKSNNSCLKAIPNNLVGFNPGSLSLVASGLSPVDQVTSGQLAAGQIDGASAVNNAGKLLDAAKSLGDKIPGFNAEKAKIGKEAEAVLIAAGRGSSAGAFGDMGSSSSPMNMSPSQAAAELEKELNQNESKINTANGGETIASPAGGNEQLEFGMTADQLAADQTALADVMDQKMDYGQNDISTSSDTNLFEVLSNRYQKSGMRRLFDEDGKTAPDLPSNSDITP